MYVYIYIFIGLYWDNGKENENYYSNPGNAESLQLAPLQERARDASRGPLSDCLKIAILYRGSVLKLVVPFWGPTIRTMACWCLLAYVKYYEFWRFPSSLKAYWGQGTGGSRALF